MAAAEVFSAESDTKSNASTVSVDRSAEAGAVAAGSPSPEPQQATPSTAAAAGGTTAADADAAQFDFFTRLYKVEPCLLRVPHDWAQCPFAHRQGGERSARRDLRVYPYQSVPCVYAKQRQPCPNGDLCPHAHSLTEYWLHPSRFRTERCQFGSACKRPVCFFAHTAEQLRPLDPSLPPAELCWQTGSSLTFGRGKRSGGRAGTAGPAAPALPLSMLTQANLLDTVGAAAAGVSGPAATAAPSRPDFVNLTSLVAALPASSEDLLAGATLLPVASQQQVPQKQQQQQRLQQVQCAPASAEGYGLGLAGVPPIGVTDPALSALLAATHHHHQQQQQQLTPTAAAMATTAASQTAAGWALSSMGPVVPAAFNSAAGAWQPLQRLQQQQQDNCAGMLAAGGRQPSGSAVPLAMGNALPAVAVPQQVVYMMLGGTHQGAPSAAHLAVNATAVPSFRPLGPQL